MEMRAHLLEEIGEPVPPITGLEDDLGMLTCLRELGGKGTGVVVEVHGLEDLAGAVLVDDDRAAAVEVDADVALFAFHGSSPLP